MGTREKREKMRDALFSRLTPTLGYDTFKRMLLSYTPLTDNLTTHFTASFLAGVTAATVTSPIDVIKTRVMSASGKSSLPRVLSDIYAAEGLRWMFKGWVPSFLRLGPYVSLLLPPFSILTKVKGCC